MNFSRYNNLKIYFPYSNTEEANDVSYRVLFLTVKSKCIHRIDVTASLAINRN